MNFLPTNRNILKIPTNPANLLAKKYADLVYILNIDIQFAIEKGSVLVLYIPRRRIWFFNTINLGLKWVFSGLRLFQRNFYSNLLISNKNINETICLNQLCVYTLSSLMFSLSVFIYIYIYIYIYISSKFYVYFTRFDEFSFCCSN